MTSSPTEFDGDVRSPTGRARIPVVLNTVYVLAMVALNVILFAGLPIFLLPESPWYALLLVPVCLSAPLHWALIHEATHRLLHPAPALNRGFGRVLSVLFLCPFDVLRVGHLCHHALNGRPSDRPEIYDPSKTPHWRAALVYYFRLGAGLYLGELICTLLALLPRPVVRKVARSMAYGGNDDSLRIPDIAEHQLTEPSRLRQIRIDAIVILALWALAVWAWGWTVWLFLAAVLLRGAFVSLHDNAPHYGMPLGDVHQGHDSRLAPMFRWFFLNANFHGTHHRNPTLPWSELPGRFAKEGGTYRGHYLSSPFRQLRGVIEKPRLAP